MAQEGTFSKPRNANDTTRREVARDEEDCRTITEMLGQVGDKWTVRVVGSLGDRPLRFTEIRKKVGGISQKMLTSTLRALERDGFITRTVYPTIPPKVEAMPKMRAVASRRDPRWRKARTRASNA